MASEITLMIPIDTRGRDELQAWVSAEPTKHTLAFLSREIGCSSPAVGAWLRGISRPVSHHRRIIHALCGIDPLAWDTDEERNKIAAFEAQP